MRIPAGMMKNTAVVLALCAALMAVAGMAVAMASYAAFFLFLQGIDSAVSPQMDLAIALSSDAQETFLSSASATGSANGAIANASLATLSLAEATGELGGTLSSFAQNPLFGSQFWPAAQSLQNASGYFSNASASLASISNSTTSASASLTSLAAGMATAKRSISDAKQSFKSALNLLSLAGLFAALCAIGLFSSTLLLSSSVLVSHYPDFFDLEEGEKKEEAKGKNRS